MIQWDPAAIKKVVLTESKLEEMHIGTLVNLEELNLSRNRISTLQGTGIEQCTLLKVSSASQPQTNDLPHA